MVVSFSKKKSNYSKDNIVKVLFQAAQFDNNLYAYINSKNYIVKIEGDIHRSQWTADNRKNNYWIKIKVYNLDMIPQPGYDSIHIYVCFQTIYLNYNTNPPSYIIGNCINPPPIKGTDLADINEVTGFWSYVNISYGVTPKTYYFNTNNLNIKKPPKKVESKKLDIINPKTGKKIEIN